MKQEKEHENGEEIRRAGEGAHLAGGLGGVEPASLPADRLHVVPAINLSHLAVVPKHR